MLPDPAFAGLPGWLAFTTAPRAARHLPWTPAHPNAKAVILHPTGFEELAEGTTFTALTGQGAKALRYSELSEIAYGADDVPVLMAAFRGPYDFAEGPIWILPEGGQGARTAPPEEVMDAPDRRSWRVGEFVVELRRIDALAFDIAVRCRGQELVRRLRRPVREDLPLAPLDLTEPEPALVPVPLAAFALGEASALVLKTAGYEGLTFPVLAADEDGVREAGSVSVYVHAN